MKQKRYETRMTLTVPSRGVITIDGSASFISKFFDEIKTVFINELAAALKYDSGMKGRDFDVVETHTRPNQTSLEIVEKTG